MMLGECPGVRLYRTLQAMVKTMFYSKCDGKLLNFILSIIGNYVFKRITLASLKKKRHDYSGQDWTPGDGQWFKREMNRHHLT